MRQTSVMRLNLLMGFVTWKIFQADLWNRLGEGSCEEVVKMGED
jgi:hypothetical protein